MQFYIEIYGFISLNPIITYFFLSDLTCTYLQILYGDPDNSDKIVEDLIKDKMIKRNDAGFFNLTNMGIVLLSNDMNLYEGYSIHSIRVIWYQGNNRLETRSERVYSGGYLNSFEQIIDYLRTILAQEIIEADMLRKQGTVYPLIALRELLANTLIHQSFERRGTHPTI